MPPISIRDPAAVGTEGGRVVVVPFLRGPVGVGGVGVDGSTSRVLGMLTMVVGGAMPCSSLLLAGAVTGIAVGAELDALVGIAETAG